MKRTLKLTFVSLVSLVAVLILTLVCAFAWIMATETGTQFAWKRTQKFLPNTVGVNAIEGCLASPLVVRGLVVKTDAFLFELDSLQLEWRPSRLLMRVLDVELITVEGIRYTQLTTAAPKSKEASKPFNLPEAYALPLGVRLARGSLRDFKFRSQPDADPFVIHSANLTADAARHKIDISNLSVDAPLFAVTGMVSLTTDRDYLLNGELHWRVTVPEDYPAISGRTDFKGSLRELNINQRIAKPYDAQAKVLLRNPLSHLEFEAALNVKPLKLQALNEALPPMTVQLGITGQGDPDEMAFNLSAWVEDPGVGRVNATMGGGLKSETITIDELKITVPDQPARLEASGQIELAGDQALNFKADWHDLQWPLDQPQINSTKGHVILGGKIEDYSLDIQANVVVPEKTDAQFQITGRGSKETLDLSRIDIRALEGDLAGTLKLRWKPDLEGAVSLKGQGLNPGVILKAWPGKLGFSLRAQGGVKGKQPRLQIEQLHAQGQLRGHALSLDAAGRYEENRTQLKRLELSSGTTRLEASGTMGDALDVRWQVHSEDLGTLLPSAKGRIDGKGTLAGPVKRPHVKAELTVKGLAYSDYRLTSLDLDGDVDLTGGHPSRVVLTLQEGSAAGVELHKIALNGQGDLDAHTFTLSADTSRGQADIALQGGLLNPWTQEVVWNFHLDQAKLKYPNLESWVMRAPSTGRIAAAQAQISQSCWQSGEALLCLQGKQSTEEIQANFDLTDLPLTYFGPYLSSDIQVEGSLNGKGAFSQARSQAPDVAIDIKTTTVRLASQDANPKDLAKDPLLIEFQPGHIQLQMQQGGLQAGLNLPLSKSDGIGMQAAIDPGEGPLMERPLKGQITAEIENLAFIADLIPEVQTLAGRLKGDMALAGSLTSPELKGRLALIDGAARLDRPGLSLEDIRVELSGTDDGAIRLSAHAVSEKGELNIDGSADLRGNEHKADIKVKGEHFRVVNTHEAMVDASPDLTFVLRGNRVDVEGDVVIPKAQIRLKKLPESAVNVSDDQVIIVSEGAEKPSETAGREMHARVRIILGDAVSFNGFGLNAHIEGNLLATERPGEPTTGSGELRVVDGEYRAYGQGLVIEKGRVLFAGGPIARPGLDVRAVRRPVQGIVVGVQVRGDLIKPDFTLFSDPSMTQGNQLAYLVLGRPLSGASGSEGSALSRAALALGLRGGNSVAQKIGGKLGLDQFGVEPGEAGSDNSPEQASFMVGKYLTPKLYVSYGIGLFDPVSTVRLQYAISSHWKLATESSGAVSGGDLIYTIETGQ